MLVGRQILARLAAADVVLFLIASAFNDHSSTSFDGIVWWIAIGGFGLLIVAACGIVVGFVWNRAVRRGRPRTRA